MSETVEKFITDIDLECFLKELQKDGLISTNKDYGSRVPPGSPALMQPKKQMLLLLGEKVYNLQ